MSDYITWKNLKRRWKKLDSQLLKYLQKELQPYYQHESPKCCPEKYHKYYHLHSQQSKDIQSIKTLENNPDYDDLVADILPSGPDNGPKKSVEERIKELKKRKIEYQNKMNKIEEEDPHCFSWKYFINPQADGEIDKIISDLKKTIFKMKDVLEFEKIHELGKTIKKNKQTEDRKNTIPKRADIEEHLESSIQGELEVNGKIKAISFYKSGDIWWIGEKGEELQFTPLKGFDYISFLIRNIAEEFNPLDIYYLGDVPSEIKEQVFEPQQKLKRLSNGEYEKVLQQLEENLYNELNPEKRIEIIENIEELEKYQNTGDYSFSKESDKCRINVYNNIKKAIKKIHEKFKERGDNDIIRLFNIGKQEIFKSGKKFCYNEKLIGPEIQWQLDPE